MWQTSGSQIRTQTAAAPQRSLHSHKSGPAGLSHATKLGKTLA